MRTIALAWGLVVVLGGCARSRPPVVGAVGPRGGTVATADRTVEIEVPEGALTAEIEISIASAESVLAGAIGPAYELGPSGTTFALPVAVRLRHAGAPEGARVAVREDGAWVPLASPSRDGDLVWGTTLHFSTFAIVGGDADAGEVDLGRCDLDSMMLSGPCTIGTRCMVFETPYLCRCPAGTWECASIEDGGPPPDAPCPDGDGDGRMPVLCGGDDCDDADPATFPGATELCDGIDQDCDESTVGTLDGDADGFPSGACCNPLASGDPPRCGADCDDADPAVGPTISETSNGRDDDCDRAIDEGC
jgi:hypothetical protein